MHQRAWTGELLPAGPNSVTGQDFRPRVANRHGPVLGVRGKGPYGPCLYRCRTLQR